MAFLDPDDPCYNIFKCDLSMDCDTHVESEYYASKIMPLDIPMCCHCAGTSKSLIECTLISWHKMVVPILSFCLFASSALLVARNPTWL